MSNTSNKPRKRRIGIMLELNWPFKRHTDIFAGTQRFAEKMPHWDCVVDEFIDRTLPDDPKELPPYDGIIARVTRPLWKKVQLHQIPAVNVWFNSPVKNIPLVTTDFPLVAKLRAEHLLSRGFERFAILTHKQDKGQTLELESFIRRVHQQNPDYEVHVAHTKFNQKAESWQSDQKIINQWMDKWVTPMGVFVATDPEGRQIAQMCRSRGWRVPQDVAIVCGYNQETICENPSPGLTSVEIGYERIGYYAAELLESLMNGEPNPESHLMIPPIGLVARTSTDFYAVDDEMVTKALKYIASHSSEQISVNDVAKAVNMSRSTIERRFKKYLNRPIAAEIRRLKLERVKRQLAETTLTVKSIAKEAGFGDAMSLSRVFRREFNTSPRTYRLETQRKY